MDALSRLASQRPIAFGVLVTFLLLALYMVAGVTAVIISNSVLEQQTVEAVGRLAASAFIIWMLWRLGWVSVAGLTRFGTWSVWLLVLLVVAYQLAVAMFAFFGDLDFGVADPAQASVVALNGSAAGLLEELGFRGLVLYALLRTWGNSATGLTGSVLLSSLLFGASHLIRIGLGQPVPEVSLLALDAFIAGIYYAAFVLYSRSLWPAIAIHVLLNAVVGARAVGVAGFEETVSGWLLILVFELPTVLLGIYLLGRVRNRTDVVREP